MNSQELHQAALDGDAAKIKALIEKGADVNGTTDKGLTALFRAAEGGHAEIVQLLLDRGADPNLAQTDGTTVLMSAAYKGHIEIVRVLLAKDANVDARKKNGGSALDAANGGRHAEIRTMLMRAGAIEDSVDSNVVRQLVLAVAKGGIDEIKSQLARANLKEINANFDGMNMQDATLLHLAVVAGRADAVEALLAAGAYIDSQDAKGSTPLHIAANMKDREDVARVLLVSGADTEIGEYRQGIKPLHFAAMMGRDHVVAILLDGRADKNALDSDGCSPLHYAAVRGHAGALKRLLSAGADPNVRLKGETPLDVALKMGHTEVAELLRPATRKASASQ